MKPPSVAAYLTEAQLAARWCASRSTIQRLVLAGKLSYFARPPPPGGVPRRLYPIEAIKAIEIEQTIDQVVVGLPKRPGNRRTG